MRPCLFAAVAVAVVVAVSQPGPAAADLAQPAVVSENPVDYTPHVLDGTVWSMVVIGDTVVVGGTFTSVADSARDFTYARRNIFAFGLYDGVVRPFAPAVDGTVYSLAAGPDDTVYLGGAFTTINGVKQHGLAQVALTGERMNSFRAFVDGGEGYVRTLGESDGWLYVGGMFATVNRLSRDGLARVDADTGAVDTDFDAQLSAQPPHRTGVENLDISPDGRLLVVIGGMRMSGSTDRAQIAMFDLTVPGAPLTGWYTNAYAPPCAPSYDTYVRQVKFSPDGSYFVVVSTGGTSSPLKLCDAAARFETAGTGPHDPVWSQLTGGNSLFAVAVTGAAVYLGGHQLYLDNPFGHKSKDPGKPPVYRPGPGAVMRPGIGAVDPVTGRALPWDPTRNRGVGVHVFVAVPQGLLVGSDTDQLGHEYHGRIGMFPLD